MTKVDEILEEYKLFPPTGHDYPVLTLTEKNGFVHQSDRFNKRLATEDTSKYKVISMEDIAFNPYLLWAGAIAQNTIVNKGIISPLYPTFRVKEGYHPRYVAMLLLSPTVIKMYDNIAFGSVPRRRRTSIKDFLSLTIPTPPSYEEQKRIVAILDKAQSTQKARERQLTTLDELLISFFKDSFHTEDYPHKPLKEIAIVLSGGTPRSSVQEYWNGNIEWVTPADLGQHEGIYFSSSSRKITDAGLKNSSAVLLPTGSVMMSSRAPIGHLAINTVPMATNQGFKSIVPGEEITNLYLLFWFKSHMTYIQNLGVGATFKEISKNVVENIKVPVPPIAEQERFSQKVSKIISQQTLIHKSLENDNSLFLSIQSKFFNY